MARWIPQWNGSLFGNGDSGQAKQAGGYFITLVDLFGRSTGN
jgi:hypothetical protein